MAFDRLNLNNLLTFEPPVDELAREFHTIVPRLNNPTYKPRYNSHKETYEDERPHAETREDQHFRQLLSPRQIINAGCFYQRDELVVVLIPRICSTEYWKHEVGAVVFGCGYLRHLIIEIKITI